jgi:hypothetical protein
MRDAEFWPKDICKVDIAARYLQDNRKIELNNAVLTA